MNGHADGDGCPDSVRTVFDIARSSVEQFWTKEASAIGVTYGAPTSIVLYQSEIATPCGTAQRGNAFFCRVDRGLYFDSLFLETEMTRGDMAPVVIVAHEWGHFMQNLASVNDSIPIRHELQADCLAGAYTQYAAGLGMLEKGDTTEAREGLFRAGSTDILWLDPQAHGSPGNRIDSFNWGFKNAAQACTESEFMRKAGGTVPLWVVSSYPAGSLGDIVPPRVGDFVLVDVSRRNELITSNATDAVRGKYRATDGAMLNHWIVAHPSDAARVEFFDYNKKRYGEQGWIALDDGNVEKDGATIGAWVLFSNDTSELILWGSGQISLIATGPAGRVLDFARRHPF